MPEKSYNPDYAVPPGWLLEEHIESAGLSVEDFARLWGYSPELIGRIIAGGAPVDPETAAGFERVVGMPAHIWEGIEAAWAASNSTY